MSYPQGERYLEQIQKNREECERIKDAYYLLKAQRERKWPEADGGDDLKVQFYLLGEAFELASWTLDAVPDLYHFMDDVLVALLTPEKEG